MKTSIIRAYRVPTPIAHNHSLRRSYKGAIAPLHDA